MLNRLFFVVAFACFTVAALGQTGAPGCNTAGVSCVWQMPGPNAGNGGFVVTPGNSNSLNSLFTGAGPIGMSYVIAAPNGKYYMVGPSQAQSVDTAFATAPRVINGLAGPPTAAAITPNGNFLLLGTADGNGNGLLYIIDTKTDLVTGNGGILLPGPPAASPGSSAPYCPACFIAVSQDSSTAYVLTNTGVGGRASMVNLSTRQVTSQLVLTGNGGNSITISPAGLLYIPAQNVIFEINPANFSFTLNSPIQVNASPFRLHFTPDGTRAYMTNLTPSAGGRSLVKLTISGYALTYWPTNFTPGAPTFDEIQVAGNQRVFAYESSQSLLADIAPDTLTPTPSVLTIGPGSIPLTVTAVAVSNELPDAKAIYLLEANGNQNSLIKFDLTTNTPVTQNQVAANIPVMQDVTVPSQSQGASFLIFGSTSQILNSGGAGNPIRAILLDSSGLPVYNAAVSITTDPTNGAVITNATTVTNANGFVTANLTVPNTCGTYNFTVASGAASQVYAITVPGNCNSGGGPNPGGGNGQVSIVTGDGQVVLPGVAIVSTTGDPLTIKVTDTTGKPLQGISVTFSTGSDTTGVLATPQTITDANGIASSFYTGIFVPALQSYITTTITATAFLPNGAQGVSFTVTSIPIATGGTSAPQFNIKNPTPPTMNITVPEGTPVNDAIVVQILANPPGLQAGQGIPGVSIYTYTPNSLANPDGTIPPPPAVCGPGSQKSDNIPTQGYAHCTLIAACKVGTYSLYINYGGGSTVTNGLAAFSPIFPFNLTVTQGIASGLNIVAGNNQTGVSGQTVSGLTASLVDGCNNTIANTPVTWTVKSGSATLVNTINSTNANGTASTGVKFGSTPGQVVVEISAAGGIKADFTLTNQIIVSSVTSVSGSGQSATQGQAFPNPLVVLVKDNSGNPVSGITVNFTVASGTVTLGATSANTGANGQAQISVSAGATAGPVVVTATAAGLQTVFNLTVKAQGPNVTNTSFVNAASLVVGLVPCGLGTLTGNGIAAGIAVGTSLSGISPFGPLPFQLGNFSMTVNNVQAPIEFISNQPNGQQVNFQSPCEIAGASSATVVVTANGAVTTVNNVPVLAAQPGIFTFQGANSKFYADIQSGADGSYVTPNKFAVRGQTYYVIVTGLNQTTPPLSTDSAGLPNQNVNYQIIVAINNAGVPVVSAQALEGFIGAYVVGFQIPAGFTPGTDLPFSVGAIVNGQNLASAGTLIAGVQ